MIVFEKLKEAFVWAFSEKEDFYKIKNYFALTDEVEKISDAFIEVQSSVIEKFLLENSYIEKRNGLYVYEQ